MRRTRGHIATRRFSAMRTEVPVGLFVLIASLSCALAGPRFVARVPFEFRAGTTHFGPGEYQLEVGDVSGSVSIRATGLTRGTDLPVRKSRGTGGPAVPTVCFRAYGDQRFLSAIQLGATTERWDLTPAADETALAQSMGEPKVISLKAAILDKEKE